MTIQIPHLLLIKGSIAVAVAFAATVTLAAKPIAAALTRKPLKEPEELVGLIAFTDVNEVNAKFGRANLDHDGQDYTLQVRSRGEIISPRFTKVKLESYDSNTDTFTVTKVETIA